MPFIRVHCYGQTLEGDIDMWQDITKEEIDASVCETGEITVSEVLDFDIVVVGA